MIFKRRDFSRWQAREGLLDDALCEAVREMECGLIDANLGGHLFKKRVARRGAGKSGGYRTLISARLGARYVFLHGFAKNERADIHQVEYKALQFVGRTLLALSADGVIAALRAGVLMEVRCAAQDH